MTTDTGRLQARSDLYLLLSRVFLPPMTEGIHAAMSGVLADDLTACADAIPVEIDRDLRRFRAEMARVADDRALLVLYSQFHLAPPVPAPLNAGLYLDGAVLGPSVVAMEACYHHHGMARAAGFKDLSDHLSVQLEFVALLLAEAAAAEDPERRDFAGAASTFVESFVRPWIPALMVRIDRAAIERDLPAPHRPLLEILVAAMAVGTGVSRPSAPSTTARTPAG
ncbi:MAG: molecular chaperone [Rhodospirillales bacterium]